MTFHCQLTYIYSMQETMIRLSDEIHKAAYFNQQK